MDNYPVNTNRKAVSRLGLLSVRGLAQPLRSSGTCSKSDAGSRVAIYNDLATISNGPEIGGINQRSVRARGWSALTQIVVMIDTHTHRNFLRGESEINRARSRLESADFRKASFQRSIAPWYFFEFAALRKWSNWKEGGRGEEKKRKREQGIVY